MLFTEECDKVRDLMHVHSFSYDFHLRVVHQYLVGSHMTLRQGYQLTDFLGDFIAHHPDIPKFGRNRVFQGDRRRPGLPKAPQGPLRWLLQCVCLAGGRWKASPPPPPPPPTAPLPQQL